MSSSPEMHKGGSVQALHAYESMVHPCVYCLNEALLQDLSRLVLKCSNGKSRDAEMKRMTYIDTHEMIRLFLNNKCVCTNATLLLF